MPHPFFDSPVFPWHRPDAQALYELLCRLIPSHGEIVRLLRMSDENLYDIAPARSTAMWSEALDMTAAHLLLPQLFETLRNKRYPAVNRAIDAIESAQSENRESDAAARSHESLSAAADSPASPATRSAGAFARRIRDTTTFLRGNDRVDEKEIGNNESLLFHDDLTISASKVPELIATLEHLVRWSPAVCRLDVSYTDDVELGTGYGTAFRIGTDLLLTAWHVFFADGWRAYAVNATFGFEDGPLGREPLPHSYACRLDSIVGDADTDWAVIRIDGRLPDTVPILSLDDAGAAAVKGAAYLIQHPEGERKRVAYTRNMITYCDDLVVQYLSDTRVGSSGSPVLDAQGRLIALHRVGGNPQQIAGRPPLKKNEGIAIARVRAGLNDKGVAF